MKKLLLLLTTTVWLLSNDNPHRTMSDHKFSMEQYKYKVGSVTTRVTKHIGPEYDIVGGSTFSQQVAYQ